MQAQRERSRKQGAALKKMQFPDEILDEFRPTDDCGRVYFGPEYGDKMVNVAILDVEDKD